MRLDLGHIDRFRNGDYVAVDDEALIFIDDDNERTIHIQCPDARAVAEKIIAAVSAYEQSEKGEN